MLLTTFSKKIIDISNLEQNNNVVNIGNFPNHLQYYKQEAMILNELTGNYLAKYFNLPAPDLAIFKDNNRYGLLYTPKDGIVLKYDRTNLYKFIENIYKKYHDKELVKQLLSVIVIDIIMGNPCRYRSTLLFNDENKSLKLNFLTGFAYSYLSYNDLNHPSIDALEIHEHHGDLYTDILEYLPKILPYSLYLQDILKESLNLNFQNVISSIENIYDISTPSYLMSRILEHEYQSKKIIKERILERS